MSSDNSKKTTKKKYVKPLVETEDLTSFGAVCNGSTTGGRKASTAPGSGRCKASRLNS